MQLMVMNINVNLSMEHVKVSILTDYIHNYLAR